MYSLQALWSQAREHLKIITIICANQEYAILKVGATASYTPPWAAEHENPCGLGSQRQLSCAYFVQLKAAQMWHFGQNSIC